MTSQLASETSIERTQKKERSQSIRTLTLAFCADPVLRYCYPDPRQYLEHFPAFVEAFGGKSFDMGRAFHDGDFLGAALWLPPDTYPDDEVVYRHFERTVELRKVKTIFSVLDRMGAAHPSEPRWYLTLIGVDIAHPGPRLGVATSSFHAQRNRPARAADLLRSQPILSISSSTSASASAKPALSKVATPLHSSR